MAFMGINKERFRYILAHGTQEGELKKFFLDCKIPLLNKGARIQNLPHGRESRIKAICEKFPSTTDLIVKSWFQQNIKMVDPISASEIVEEFKLYEEEDATLPIDQANRLSRSSLTHLFSEMPDGDLIKFLQTRIGGNAESIALEHDSKAITEPCEHDAPQNSIEQIDIGDGIIELLAAISCGEDVGDSLDKLPSELGLYAGGLASAMRGDISTAQMFADSLETGSKQHQLLLRNIKRSRSSDRVFNNTGLGLQIAPPNPFAGEFDSKNDSVLGYCTSSLTVTSVFVQPQAIIRNGKCYFLTAADRISIFPEVGDVMAFTGPGKPKQPARGDIDIWKVEKHDTEKRVRFHLKSFVDKVYEAFRVPFFSSDIDSIREFIKSSWQNRNAAPQLNQLYVLADGIIFAPKNDHLDLSKSESFDQPFNAWTRLEALSFEGRTLILGPLPAATTTFDCAPIASTVKQLTKAAVERKSTGLTSSQIRELALAFQGLDIGMTAERFRRIEEQLDRLSSDYETLDEVVPLLMKHPTIESLISKGVEAEVISRSAKKTEIQREIAALKAERTQCENRNRELQLQNKKLGAEASASVKAAFDKAVNNGIDALANVAVINALKQSNSNHLEESGSKFEVGQTIKTVIPSSILEHELFSDLSKIGVDRRTAIGITALLKLAGVCGIAVCFKGMVSRVVVKKLISAIGTKSVIAEIGVGLIDSDPLTNLIDMVSAEDAIGIIDADISSLDLYARGLIDHLLVGSLRGEVKSGPLILLSLSSSLIALPIPEILAKLSITIDLDKKVEYSQAADYQIGNFIEEEEFAPRKERFHQLGNLINDLDDEIRVVINSILAGAT